MSMGHSLWTKVLVVRQVRAAAVARMSQPSAVCLRAQVKLVLTTGPNLNRDPVR